MAIKRSVTLSQFKTILNPRINQIINDKTSIRKYTYLFFVNYDFVELFFYPSTIHLSFSTDEDEIECEIFEILLHTLK